MPLARDRLVFLCLAALDDIVQRCATAPALPTPQYRAVLAMLYVLGDGDDRTLFDTIWQISQLAPSQTLKENQANHRRSTELGKMWPMVVSRLGVERTTELSLRLAAARLNLKDGHRPAQSANFINQG